MDWSTWLQNVSAGVVDKYTTAQWVQPYNVEQMRLQALGQLGYYPEGQRVPTQPQGIGGMNSGTLLLIGGAVVVAMLLMKK